MAENKYIPGVAMLEMVGKHKRYLLELALLVLEIINETQLYEY